MAFRFVCVGFLVLAAEAVTLQRMFGMLDDADPGLYGMGNTPCGTPCKKGEVCTWEFDFTSGGTDPHCEVSITDQAKKLGGGGSGAFVGLLKNTATGNLVFKQFDVSKVRELDEMRYGFIPEALRQAAIAASSPSSRMRLTMAQAVIKFRVEYGYPEGDTVGCKRVVSESTPVGLEYFEEMITYSYKTGRDPTSPEKNPLRCTNVYLGSPAATFGSFGKALFEKDEDSANYKRLVTDADEYVADFATLAANVLRARASDKKALIPEADAFFPSLWKKFVKRTKGCGSTENDEMAENEALGGRPDGPTLISKFHNLAEALRGKGQELHAGVAEELIGMFERVVQRVTGWKEAMESADKLRTYMAETVHSDMNLGNVLVEEVNPIIFKFNDNAAGPGDKSFLETEIVKSYFGFLHQGILDEDYPFQATDDGDSIKLQTSGEEKKTDLTQMAGVYETHLLWELEQGANHEGKPDICGRSGESCRDVADRAMKYANVQRLSDCGFALVDNSPKSQSDEAIHNGDVEKMKNLVERCFLQQMFVNENMDDAEAASRNRVVGPNGE